MPYLARRGLAQCDLTRRGLAPAFALPASLSPEDRPAQAERPEAHRPPKSNETSPFREGLYHLRRVEHVARVLGGGDRGRASRVDHRAGRRAAPGADTGTGRRGNRRERGHRRQQRRHGRGERVAGRRAGIAGPGGTTLSPARPACTPQTGSSARPLPDLPPPYDRSPARPRPRVPAVHDRAGGW